MVFPSGSPGKQLTQLLLEDVASAAMHGEWMACGINEFVQVGFSTPNVLVYISTLLVLAVWLP